MKNVLLILLLFSSSAFAQKANFISDIRTIVERINTDSGYKTKTLENEEFMGEEMTDGGGTLTGYFKDGKLIKINEWIGLSSGIVSTEYFLNEGNLIFIYQQKRGFQYIDKADTSYWDYNDQRIIRENRYYFQNDKIIKKLRRGTRTLPLRTKLLNGLIYVKKILHYYKNN